MERYDVVIVGAGHAGAQAAIALRQLKFEGSIALIGDEPDPPYERPPLTKEYLAGEKPFERMLIRPAHFWEERSVTLRLAMRIVAVDALAHRVASGQGDEIGYGSLIWAAGGSPRRLPCAGADLAGVHHVRTRADVDRLLAELPHTGRIVVIGGGYIGLEAAAALIGHGKRVTIVEAQPRLLSRVAGSALADFYAAEHAARGVEVRLGALVSGMEGDGRVTGVRLSDGELLPCEMAIVGIGIVPETGPLIGAAAAGGNGVWVDARCATSLPDIYAIGDCALHANAFADGAEIRLESVQNAHDQAAVAARAIIGQPVEYDAVPWFWSNQYDLKLQTVGLSAGHDAAIVRGDPVSRSFSVVYLREGRVIALDCVNRVRDYVQGRKLVVDRIAADPAALADPEVLLKTLA